MLLSSCGSPLLTVDVINRCKAAGILTVLDFVSSDQETLSQKLSIPYKNVASIRSLLLSTYSPVVQTGENFYKDQLQSLSILSTGCPKIDKFLDGGIYSGEVTGIHGCAASGKTQFCLNLICKMMLESDNTYLYLDTNGGFSAQRLEQMLLKHLTNPELIKEKLKLLRVVNIHDAYELFDILHGIRSNIINSDDSFSSRLKLLVLDSITPLFAPLLSENNSLGPGLLATASQLMKMLSADHALATVVCNNMVRSEFSVKPALGNFWTNIPSVTLCIMKNYDTNNHSIVMVKNYRQAVGGEVRINITDCGISSVDDGQ